MLHLAGDNTRLSIDRGADRAPVDVLNFAKALFCMRCDRSSAATLTHGPTILGSWPMEAAARTTPMVGPSGHSFA